MDPVRRLAAEPVTDVCTDHGEGVVWDDRHRVVRFVDMLEGALLAFDPADGSLDRHRVAPVATAVRPRRGGGLVVALERSLRLLDDDLLGGRELPAVFDDPGIRFNDGGCDPAGRFWMGTMAYVATPGAGTLYRLDPDGSATAVLHGVGISNGLSFAADGRSAYYVDTLTDRVDVLDVDPGTGTVLGRRPFVELDGDAEGHPDGIAVDALGGVWVALFGGSAVHRYTPDGVLEAVVTVPARQVTCPALGGPDLTDLYVTTSRQDLAADDDPLAGALFRVAAGVPGLPVLPFAG